MITNFTFNDLLMFHYNELNEAMRNKVALALEFDSDLQEQYDLITSTTSFLDTAKRSPSVFSLDYILNYSKNANGALETI